MTLQQIFGQCAQIIDQHSKGVLDKGNSKSTIFHSILESRQLPAEEKKLRRAGMDGFSLIRAGTESISTSRRRYDFGF